ncbi:guanosine-3',5'-bis(diphosphate) 3'-pyrophosphohydrolase [Leptospira tipperaryensis]|uniref:Guanosine-3',5'-bis(Diphosphate) 3'-pyrophosphohydrolase n=1 Tax=Leptospira tipperaryensis TaxID=2564040 RepID=A0A1D7UUB3_9LEPT|nr:HD domain-containing protein [Leptospira tipperaryensis]AOP33141.1 guanosine-3',5'-bis(diphosphate) 3'-pyrophosphohydrolase [Leptospira tipperaryensis]
MNQQWSVNRVQEAWELASRLHDGQKYGGVKQNEKVEYLTHIGSVVLEISNALQFDKTINADLAILCGILHDTIEDTDLKYEEVVSRFGRNVADGVLALSKDEKIPEKEKKMIDSIERIKKQPREIWIVKMADRISNLYAPPYYWDNDKKRTYQRESLFIYDGLKSADSYIANRLKQKIEDYDRYIEKEKP